jgi:hypothetical protein
MNMSKPKKRHSEVRPMWQKGVLFGLVVALLLVALTSLWLQRAIFNTDRFTAITTAAFTEESSRQSIGETVANRVFEGRPALRVAVGDRLSGAISSLLATERAESAIARAAREAQLLVTSPRRDPVVLQLSGLKTAIVRAQELTQVEANNVRIDDSDIPDQIVLIDTSTLPNFYVYAVTVFWLGPVSLLAAVALTVWWVRRGGAQLYVRRSQIMLLVLLVSAGLALLIGPLAEPAFVSIGRDAPSQTLLSNAYRGFIAPFRDQAIVLGVVSALALLSLTAWQRVLRQYQVKVSIVRRKS